MNEPTSDDQEIYADEGWFLSMLTGLATVTGAIAVIAAAVLFWPRWCHDDRPPGVTSSGCRSPSVYGGLPATRATIGLMSVPNRIHHHRRPPSLSGEQEPDNTHYVNLFEVVAKSNLVL
jgi:hypothetical protein